MSLAAKEKNQKKLTNEEMKEMVGYPALVDPRGNP